MCSTQVAVAAAIASHVTRRPVRVALSLEENFEMMGKRLPYLTEYEVTLPGNSVNLSQSNSVNIYWMQILTGRL